jgi:prophage antirepressor-like protein
MNALTKLNHQFEGHSITTIEYKGRPAWIAREVGEALGYADEGRGFITTLTRNWAEEFIEGHDHTVLTGTELAEFKQLFKDSDDLSLCKNPIEPTAARVFLLFESGLNMALTKTDKEAGVKLRRFLVDEVLPQIVRTGSFNPLQPLDPKFLLEERKLAFEEKKLKTRALERLEKALRATGNYSADVLATLAVAHAEEALGRSLHMFKPAVAETPWATAEILAERYGVTTQRIGLVRKAIGLVGNVSNTTKVVLTTVKGGTKTVSQTLYAPAAVKQIEEALQKGGHI